MDAPLAAKCADLFMQGYIKATEENKMEEKIKEIQKYLEKKGIVATETSIVNAAIKIATRWGGKDVFICEFEKRDNQ